MTIVTKVTGFPKTFSRISGGFRRPNSGNSDQSDKDFQDFSQDSGGFQRQALQGLAVTIVTVVTGFSKTFSRNSGAGCRPGVDQVGGHHPCS